MVGERSSGDLQVDSRRNGLLQLRQAGADAVHCLNDIGFRQFADHQQDRRFGVGHPGVAYVLHRIRDGSDISQPHRGAILIVDDQWLIVGGGLQLIVGLHLPAVRAVLQRPLRFAHVGVADGGAHRVQRHALVKQRLWVEVDAHRRQGAAADVDIAHAVDLRDGLRQLGGGEIIQLTLGSRCPRSASGS